MNEEKEKKIGIDDFHSTIIKGIQNKLNLLNNTLICPFREELYSYNTEFKSIHLTTIEEIIKPLQKLKEYIEKGEYESFHPY